MIKLYIKLNDSDLSFEIIAKQGKEILNTVRGNYEKDLADKLIKGISHLTDLSGGRTGAEQVQTAKTIKGLDKNIAYVRLKKRGKFKVYYEETSKSFVSNLIGNSVASMFNWLEK